MPIEIQVIPSLGTTIQAASLEASDVANQLNCRVILIFNDLKIEVLPLDKTEDIVHSYMGDE